MAEKQSIQISCPLCNKDDSEDLFTREEYKHVRCRSCGLVYVNPRVAQATEFNAQLFGRDHPVWSKASGRFHAMDRAEQAVFLERSRYSPAKKYVRELHYFERVRSTNRFLDVGCADGRFLLAAQGMDWDVSGVEVAPESAALCRDGYGLDVRCGTLDQADFEKGIFDGIRLNQVIEHVDWPVDLLRQVNSFLRPGGILSLATVNIQSLTYSFLGEKWSYLGTSLNGHIIFFSRETLDRILRETGFRPLKWTTIGCRLRNPGTNSKVGGSRGIRMAEKALGLVAHLTHRGGRIHVYAEKT